MVGVNAFSHELLSSDLKGFGGRWAGVAVQSTLHDEGPLVKGSGRFNHLSLGVEDQGMAHAGAKQVQAPEAGICIGENGASQFENVDFEPFTG